MTTVASIPDADLIRRAIMNARSNKVRPVPRWSAVMDTFALGSTYAWQLCERFGLDPDETVTL
jgi:hypothetical protein